MWAIMLDNYEWTTLRVDPPAPIEPSDDEALAVTDYYLERDSEQELPTWAVLKPNPPKRWEVLIKIIIIDVLGS